MTPGPGFIRGSKLPQLLVSVLLLGIADSMIGSYLVLFGADEAQLSPLQVGVFMSVIAVSGLAVSTWLGRRYDRSASRAPAFLGAGMAAFPQLFTLAGTHLDLSARGSPGGRPRCTPTPSRSVR
jgi:MFS transporter, SET family, sugar efflux transporter